jgi:hypothetical protein
MLKNFVSVSDPYLFDADTDMDPDPDPAFWAEYQSDPDLIQIQGFDDQKLEKMCS